MLTPMLKACSITTHLETQTNGMSRLVRMGQEINSNRTLPQWHQTSDGFAGRQDGHGIVTFTGALAGDADLDNDVDTIDITNVIGGFYWCWIWHRAETPLGRRGF